MTRANAAEKRVRELLALALEMMEKEGVLKPIESQIRVEHSMARGTTIALLVEGTLP